jgi:hypothetical protein
MGNNSGEPYQPSSSKSIENKDSDSDSDANSLYSGQSDY